LFWHLMHGFESAFRTMGVSNQKYLGLLNKAGIGFSVLVGLLFASMPIAMYLKWVE
jgi:succinate dehydrogenase / fumarate reductase, cytochrome b subunit